MMIPFVFLLILFMCQIGSVKSSSSEKCDIFDGYWDSNFYWQPVGCPYPKFFYQSVMNQNLTKNFDNSLKMLFFSDSNGAKIIEDVATKFRGDCHNKGDYTFFCSSDQFKMLKQHIFSVFPFESDLLNYCVEFKGRPIEGRTYFRTNLEIMEHGINEFISTYNSTPDILEFSVNFWEMVRLREEENCEKGQIQEQAAKRREGTHLDAAYLKNWTIHFEESLRILKDKAVELNAVPFTRTFQIPLLADNGRAVHTNLGAGYFVKQLNACIRSSAAKMGINLLDVEKMTSFFNRPQDYLQDLLHYKPFISEELMNILMYWVNNKRSQQQRHLGHNFN